MSHSAPDAAPTRIKKYANRRLYNMATSSYVTLEDLARMVREGEEFTVVDARSGTDITRSVLTQIIVEEEAKGPNLLPVSVLRQLIALYGDQMQYLVPGYLEQSMRAFTDNQERMRQLMHGSMGGMFSAPPFEEMARQNMQIFERALGLFSPFSASSGGPRPESGASRGAGRGSGEAGSSEASPGGGADAQAVYEQLKAQLDALQQRLDALGDPGAVSDGDGDRDRESDAESGSGPESGGSA